MNCAIIVPTYKGARYIPFLIKSLGDQSFKKFRLIAVIKPSNDKTEDLVKYLSNECNLSFDILIQRKGNVVNALQLGVDDVSEDIVLITDDDAILPKYWIEKHVRFHKESRKMGVISGNILNYDLKSTKVLPLETGKPLVQLYRRFIRPFIDKPHRLFMKYRLGVYITKDYRVAAGPNIPYKRCFSLPCRGVNVSFKTEALKEVCFPKHSSLKRCLNWEPYIGAQIVMNSWDAFYDPAIFVDHIIRESLSRSSDAFGRYTILKPVKQYVGTDRLERQIMWKQFRDLLENTKYYAERKSFRTGED